MFKRPYNNIQGSSNESSNISSFIADTMSGKKRAPDMLQSAGSFAFTVRCSFSKGSHASIRRGSLAIGKRIISSSQPNAVTPTIDYGRLLTLSQLCGQGFAIMKNSANSSNNNNNLEKKRMESNIASMIDDENIDSGNSKIKNIQSETFSNLNTFVDTFAIMGFFNDDPVGFTSNYMTNSAKFQDIQARAISPHGSCSIHSGILDAPFAIGPGCSVFMLMKMIPYNRIITSDNYTTKVKESDVLTCAMYLYVKKPNSNADLKSDYSNIGNNLQPKLYSTGYKIVTPVKNGNQTSKKSQYKTGYVYSIGTIITGRAESTNTTPYEERETVTVINQSDVIKTSVLRIMLNIQRVVL
jgi:hypothetical protein